MNDPIADKIVERISARGESEMLARMAARHRELRAMSHDELQAEKKRLMTRARSMGLDVDELLRV